MGVEDISGDLKTLQIDTHSFHLLSLFVPKFLQLSFGCSVSSPLSCPPKVTFDLSSKGNGALLSPASFSHFAPRASFILMCSQPRNPCVTPIYLLTETGTSPVVCRPVNGQTLLLLFVFLSLHQMSKALVHFVDPGSREPGTASGKLIPLPGMNTGATTVHRSSITFIFLSLQVSCALILSIFVSC